MQNHHVFWIKGLFYYLYYNTIHTFLGGSLPEHSKSYFWGNLHGSHRGSLILSFAGIGRPTGRQHFQCLVRGNCCTTQSKGIYFASPHVHPCGATCICSSKMPGWAGREIRIQSATGLSHSPSSPVHPTANLSNPLDSHPQPTHYLFFATWGEGWMQCWCTDMANSGAVLNMLYGTFMMFLGWHKEFMPAKRTVRIALLITQYSQN